MFFLYPLSYGGILIFRAGYHPLEMTFKTHFLEAHIFPIFPSYEKMKKKKKDPKCAFLHVFFFIFSILSVVDQLFSAEICDQYQTTPFFPNFSLAGALPPTKDVQAYTLPSPEKKNSSN